MHTLEKFVENLSSVYFEEFLPMQCFTPVTFSQHQSDLVNYIYQVL